MPITVDLTDRVVAITGASSGIGEATALACASAGAAVALGARRSDRIDELARRIEERGVRAVALTTDITDEAQAHAFVDATNQRLGRLDVLVNNAGLMLLGPFEQASSEEWRRMVDVNLLGLLYCTQRALPLMRAQGSGHIVNISSVAGRTTNPGSGVYNLTKWGVGAFSDALRKETADSAIRVTVVEPGMVDTELQGHNRDEVRAAMRERFHGVTPLRADDIASAILYAIAQPANVGVNELLIRPGNQAG